MKLLLSTFQLATLLATVSKTNWQANFQQKIRTQIELGKNGIICGMQLMHCLLSITIRLA